MYLPLLRPQSGCYPGRWAAPIRRWLAGLAVGLALSATAPKSLAQESLNFHGTGLYAGVYFGTSENGEGHWAMCVSWKGEATFDFIGRASEGALLLRSYPYAAEVYSNGNFKGFTPQIDGTIVQGHVTGIGDGRFVGEIDQEDSPAAIYAGFWQSRDRPNLVVDAIVGPSGKALVAVWTPGAVPNGEDAMTRVDADGQFAVTLSGSTRVSGRIDVGTRRLVVALGNDPLPPAPKGQGQLGNFSLLSALNPAGTRIVQQFSVAGKQDKKLLLRVVGSPLAQFRGAGKYLEDPLLEVWGSNSSKVAANDNWNGNDPALLTAMQQAGAFPLPPNSRDAAQVAAFPTGDYTLVTRSAAADGTGTVLVEAFDLEPNNSPLTQVVARGRVERDEPLVAGFVVSGDKPTLLLVRAIGARLADFGVDDALADPEVKIIASNGVTIAQNDDWSQLDAPLVAAMRRAGAIVPRGANKEAAVLVSLPPGAYAASVSGAGGASGTAQIEIIQPQLARAGDAGLAVERFKVELIRTPRGDYLYEPEVLVYGTQAANPVFVWAINFHFIDGDSYPGWSPGHLPSLSVAPGKIVDLIPLVPGGRVFEFFTPTPASYVVATIRFRGRDEIEHTLTALTQVTGKF